MIYELRQFDTPLLCFSATGNTNRPEIEILWKNQDFAAMLPLDLEVTPTGLSHWLRHRIIPKSRAYVHCILSKCSLNINRPMKILQISKGLSLNDCYWIVARDFGGKFEDFNLFENQFNQILPQVALTGSGCNLHSSSLLSPEFTTNGMLPKCWRRIDGQIKLFKAGTIAGTEPYSEFYAYQVAKAMGLDAIPYGLSKWKGYLCSTCDLFTSLEVSFLPVGRLVTSGGMEAVRKHYQNLGASFEKALNDMIVFDAMICNTDRHFGNFGFLVDNKTNRIVAPAPLFDHGNSLFNYAGEDDLSSLPALIDYANTLYPPVYNDFMTEAKSVMMPAHHEALRHLLTFKFKRHSHYNLPAERLKLIEQFIQYRAKELLN